MIVLYILLGIIALIVILLHCSVTAQVALEKNKLTELRVKWLFITLYPRKEKEPRVKKQKHPNKRQAAKQVPSADKPLSPEQPATIAQLSEDHLEEIPVNAPKIDAKQRKTLENKQKELAKEKKKLEKLRKKEDKKRRGKAASGGKLDELKRKWAMLKPYVPIAWRFVRCSLKTIRITRLNLTLRAGKEDAYEAAMQYGKLNAGLFSALSVLSEVITLQIQHAQVECVFHEKILEADVSTTVKIRPSALIFIAVCTAIKALGIFLRGWFVKRRMRRKKQRERKRNSAAPAPQV